MTSTSTESNLTISDNNSIDNVIQSEEAKDDDEIVNDDNVKPKVLKNHENSGIEDDKIDNLSNCSQSNERSEEFSPNVQRNLQTKAAIVKKRTTNQESSMLDYVKNLFISSLHASSQFLLSWIGFPLGQRQIECSKSQTKRKREDRKESGDDGLDDSAEYEDEDSPGLDEKRWRPDIVVQAVERFITSFWGEKDSNENIKDNENDENMNSFISSGGNEGTWNKRPDLNFFSDSIVSDIKDVNDKGKTV